MKKLLTVIALTVLLAAPTASLALVQMLPFGFSYFTPPEAVGTATTIVGFLDPPVGFDYPFTVDFANNEYTYEITATILSIMPGPVSTTIIYSGATISIYEDASMNGDYGVSPPNGTAPSTFQDGTVILTGNITNLTRLDFNFGFPEPTAVGTINFTAGAKLSELTQGGAGWTFHAGISSNPITGIPGGYQRNWACKITPPATVPVEETTWGRVKTIYGAE